MTNTTGGAGETSNNDGFGYLSTDGNQIVDAQTGEVVRLVGVNWHGAEGYTHVPNGLWARNYKEMMDEMVELGFNVIRMPVSPAVLTEEVNGSINYHLNKELRGMSALEVMDEIVDYAGEIGIRVILDMHRRDAGVGKQEDGLWFDEDYSEADLIADWQALAGRYAGDPTVIGADLFNEPSGDARWSMDDPRTPAAEDALSWNDAAERIGNAVHEANPDLLILVEGVHIYDNQWYWVGGNLQGVQDNPVELAQDNKLVYSPHAYPWGVHNVPWLDGADAEQMMENWYKNWGYIYENGIAPILIGETGSHLKHEADVLYMDTLTEYLGRLAEESPDGQGGINLTWWTWNPNSGDTGGILEHDWSTVREDKVELLTALLGPAMTIRDAETAAALQDVIDAAPAAPEGEPEATEPDPAEEGAEEEAAQEAEQAVEEEAAALKLVSSAPAEVPAEPEEPAQEAPQETPAEPEEETVEIRVTPVDDGSSVSMVSHAIAKTIWRTKVTFEPEDFAQNENGWSATFQSESFKLSAPGRGVLEEVGENTYRLTVDDPNQGYRSSFNASLEKSIDDLVKIEASEMFADAASVLGGSVSASGKSVVEAEGVDVGIEVRDVYGDKFFARITVTNNTGEAIENWELHLDGSADFTSFAKVDVVEEDGDWVAVSGPSWNDDLEVGESFTFGVNGVVSIDPEDHIIVVDSMLL